MGEQPIYSEEQSPYQNVGNSENMHEDLKGISSHNRGAASAAEDSVPHSSRLENSLK